MSKVVRIEYFGMDGEGRNVTEAKKDAGRKLERLIRDIGTPRLLYFGDLVAFIYRDAYGWSYAFIPSAEDYKGYLCTHSSYATREECDTACRGHMFQYVADCDDYLTEADLPDFLRDASDRREALSYQAWQRAARFAQRTLGLDSNGVHAWACEHSHEFKGIRSDEYVAEPSLEAVA